MEELIEGGLVVDGGEADGGEADGGGLPPPKHTHTPVLDVGVKTNCTWVRWCV